jgi:16S rRNA (guanine527-N7)-methyltransferase
MSLLAKLQSGLDELGLTLSDQQQKQLIDYLAMIAKWNKVYNLTAIRDADEMLTHHLLDSLAVVPPLDKHLRPLLLSAPRVLDVGAGAGLPGVVIAICCPSVSVICVDTVGKKAAFIQQVAATLSLKNLKGLHSRVESMFRDEIRGGFDVITSRAFASLGDFVALTATHLTTQGVWMAMKAKPTKEELFALSVDFEVFQVERLDVPSLGEERKLVWLRKKSVAMQEKFVSLGEDKPKNRSVVNEGTYSDGLLDTLAVNSIIDFFD